MVDMRNYREIVKAAVAKEREADKNWGWSVKAITKNEIRIGWGYLDYIGEKTPFVVKLDDDDSVLGVIGTIPNGNRVYDFVGPENWHGYESIEEAIAGIIHGMARIAHNIY